MARVLKSWGTQGGKMQTDHIIGGGGGEGVSAPMVHIVGTSCRSRDAGEPRVIAHLMGSGGVRVGEWGGTERPKVVKQGRRGTEAGTEAPPHGPVVGGGALSQTVTVCPPPRKHYDIDMIYI